MSKILGSLFLIFWAMVLPCIAQDHSGFPKINVDLAKSNWRLNCQGCHKPNAAGITGEVPNMVRFIAQFLRVKGGREYLVRVPGVAYAALNDKETANLLNWMLKEFDDEHLANNFRHYTAEEVKKLRKKPFINEASIIRKKLIKDINKITK